MSGLLIAEALELLIISLENTWSDSSFLEGWAFLCPLSIDIL